MPKVQKQQELTLSTAEHGESLIEPVKYGISPPPEKFWKLLAEYPHKDSICLYIYRLWPRIDRKLTGNSHSYLDKAVMLTERDLLRRWGSGKYQIRVNDTSIGKTGKEVLRTIVELEDPDHPPVVDVAELDLTAEVNKSYVTGLRARGLLPSQQEEELTQSNGAAAEAVQVLGSLAKDALQKKEGGDLSTVREVLQVVKELRPPAGGDSDMLKLLMHQNATLLNALVSRPQAPPPPPPPDPLEQLTKMLDFVGRLRGTFKAGAPAAAGSSQSWVSELVGVLPQVAPAFADSLRSISSLRSGAGAGAPPPAAPGESAAAGALPPPVPPAAPGESAGGLGELTPARLVEVGQRALSAFQRNVPGDMFAASLLSYEPDGELVFDTLAAIGSDGVMQALRMLPNWAELEPKAPAILEWVQAFLGFADDEDDTPADPPAVAGEVTA